MSSFEENIRAQWQATYNGGDPTVEGERNYSLGWFRVGYLAGLKDGQQIGQQVYEDEKSALDYMWNLGYAQGISYAAFQVSNISINREYRPQVLEGALLMQQLIVKHLHAAAQQNAVRMEAKA